MSDTDSDLDFESADEGLKGEDIDTSDLDIDDDEPHKQSPKTAHSIPEPTPPPPANQDIKPIQTNQEKEDCENKKPVEKSEKEADFIETEKEPPKQIKQEENVVKPVESSGWEADADFSDIEDEKEEPKVVPAEVKPMESSGWEADADFSDIEEEKQAPKPQPEPVKEAKIEEKIKNLSLFKEESSSSSAGGSWSGGWSSFSSILSTATSGISSVLETVEATIGAPDPAELAKIAKKEEAEKKEAAGEWVAEEEDDGSSKGHQEWFTMGNQIVNGGLGVLETVGRKTFKVISDKDQNLKQTREFLKKVPTAITAQKPNLSQVGLVTGLFE